MCLKFVKRENTFGANLLNVMNTRETVSIVLMTIFVVKLYKKGCSVITILKTFCIPLVEDFAEFLGEFVVLGINCGGEGILTADSHILL